MKTTAQQNKPVGSPRFTEMFCDDDYGCYVEDFFLEFLVFERKRSERSGKPFLVMMLDVVAIRDPENRHEAIIRVVDALTVLIRETDIKGWYRNREVLGVIFTEMNHPNTELLIDKIYRSLNASLSAEQLKELQISFHRFPEQGKPNKPGSSANFTFYPDLPKKEKPKKNALKVKRLIDVIGSLFGIMLFSPFFILIPIGIRFTSRGPVLFRQERVGQYGNNFTFLKFRSMYVNNDEEVHKKYVQSLIAGKVSAETGDESGKPKVYKITNDKRVTSIGKILRKTSLDELPQFINVLRGEMSLVGPRPPIPYEVVKYAIWHRRRILEQKPGITGLWQVAGRSSTTFDEMVRLDLQYATNWSLWTDIKILLKTPGAVVAGKGAH